MTWLQVFISAFPPGITVERATSPKGEAKGRHLFPRRWRTSGEKGGVALSTSTPSRTARRYAGREGDSRGQPRFAFSQGTREIRVVPRSLRRFGKVSNHNGEGFAL